MQTCRSINTYNPELAKSSAAVLSDRGRQTSTRAPPFRVPYDTASHALHDSPSHGLADVCDVRVVTGPLAARGMTCLPSNKDMGSQKTS